MGLIDNRTGTVTAQVINQNKDLYTAQQQNLKTKQAINKYISDKQGEGYTLNSEGNLIKVEGNKTITININDNGKVSISEVTTTPESTTEIQTDELKDIRSKIIKTERALKSASGKSYDIIDTRLQQLYEMERNLINTGSAFYTVKTPAQTQQTNMNEVFIDGKGYSVALENQQQFIEKKQQVILSEREVQPTIFTTPKQINQSETITTNIKVDTTKLWEQNKDLSSTSGTLQARKEYDFKGVTDSENKLNTEGTLFRAQSDVVTRGNVKDYATLGVLSIGIGGIQGVRNVYTGTKQLVSDASKGNILEVGKALNPLNVVGVVAEVEYKIIGTISKPKALSIFGTVESTIELGTELYIYGKSPKVINKISDVTPKFTRQQVVGGTEQYLKYGDNRIEKQFLNKNLGNEFTLKSTDGQINLYGEDFRTLRNREQTQSTKNILQSIDVNKPKEVQKTLNNKNAFDSLRDNDNGFLVKDITESTQQSIIIREEIIISDEGKLSTQVGEPKLVPLKEKVYQEPTTKKSTIVDIKDKGIKPVDINNEFGNGGGSVFDIDSTSNRNLNQNLILVEQPVRSGKIINLPKEIDTTPQVNTVKEPIQSNTVIPITMSMYKEETKTAQVQQPSQIISVKQERQPSLRTETFTQQKYVQTPITQSISMVNYKTDTKVKQEQQVEQKQEKITLQQLKVEQRNEQRTTPITTITTKPIPKQPVEIKKPLPPKEFSTQMFSTKIKSKGKFKTIGTFSSMSEAFNRGKQYVENTASATFKIESGGQSIKPKGFLPKGYYNSKSGITQERSTRINTQGEKLEISSKGRSVQRSRFGFKKSSRGLFK